MFNIHDISGIGSPPVFSLMVIIVTDIFMFEVSGIGWNQTWWSSG